MPENDFVIEDSRTTLEPALLKRALAATRDGVSIAGAQLDDLPLNLRQFRFRQPDGLSCLGRTRQDLWLPAA